MHGWVDEIREACLRDEPGADDLLTIFFERTETSRAKGAEYIQRIFSRTEDRDEPTDLATRDAQLTAIGTWGIPDETRLNRLAGITQPTLVANGDNDVMVASSQSRVLAERIPNAKLTIYPDSAHGFLFQHHERFAADIHAFLEEDDRCR